jgi:hypothetical protein
MYGMMLCGKGSIGPVYYVANIRWGPVDLCTMWNVVDCLAPEPMLCKETEKQHGFQLPSC